MLTIFQQPAKGMDHRYATNHHFGSLVQTIKALPKISRSRRDDVCSYRQMSKLERQPGCDSVAADQSAAKPAHSKDLSRSLECGGRFCLRWLDAASQGTQSCPFQFPRNIGPAGRKMASPGNHLSQITHLPGARAMTKTTVDHLDQTNDGYATAQNFSCEALFCSKTCPTNFSLSPANDFWQAAEKLIRSTNSHEASPKVDVKNSTYFA
jgi:hypothetical protein